MAEKTIEELKAELDALEKANLERAISLQKEKETVALKEAEVLKTKEMKEQLRKEVKEELIKEMGETSKIDAPQKEQKSMFTGDVSKVRLKYGKKSILDIPGNAETLAVVKDDIVVLSSVVESRTGKKLTGRRYEDMITDMENKQLFRKGG